MTDKNVSRLHLVTGSRVTCRSAGLRYALSRMQRDSWWACKLSMLQSQDPTRCQIRQPPVASPPRDRYMLTINVTKTASSTKPSCIAAAAALHQDGVRE